MRLKLRNREQEVAKCVHRDGERRAAETHFFFVEFCPRYNCESAINFCVGRKYFRSSVSEKAPFFFSDFNFKMR